jgi:aromatic-L-amino-acid decarboxylase
MDAPSGSPLELTPAQFRELAGIALDQLAAHLAALPDAPLDGTATGGPGASLALARSLREPLPTSGTDARTLIADFVTRVVPHSYNTISPGYLAYVPGGGLPHAAIADLLADLTNRYHTVWRASPGIAEIERTVGRWLCDIVGFPAEALGVLTTGGSLAHLCAIVTARRSRLGDAEFRDTALYLSDQAHHSFGKAAVQVGFAPSQLHVVATDAQGRLRLDALARAVAADRAAGRRPFFVMASAGTTNTGAVDDLAAVADLAAAEGLWFHVDAAYGGFFALTERGRRALAGIERADSVILDPHKGLFLPYGTGALVVRDAATLRRAFGGSASYMPEAVDADDVVDLCEVSPELSRGFRGLRLWLPLKLHGIGPFVAQLDEKLDLARWAAEELRRIPGISIVAEPVLSTLAFRYTRPGASEAALTALNRDLLTRINARQRVFLSATTLGERFVIRICVVSFRTHADRIAECVQIIREAVRDVDVVAP